MREIVAALRNVTKAYPGCVAVRNLTIEFRKGEIHALVGENGAGKSTIVKMLAGLLRPDGGTLEINGKYGFLTSARAALKEGIGVVHQSGSLIETLTVGENLRLGSLYAPAQQEFNDDLCFDARPQFPITKLVSQLTPRECQLVEIYRLLIQRARLLILDEPTAILAPQESRLLFIDLMSLAEKGFTIIVVSHRLGELVGFCDRFTVLRNGRIAAEFDRAEATLERLLDALEDPENRSFDRRSTSDLDPSSLKENQEPLVSFVDVALLPGKSPQRSDFKFYPGEIVGIAGRPGSGAENVLKLLQQRSVPTSRGRLIWHRTKKNAGELNIGYAPCDRQTRGIIPALTIGENLLLRRRNLLGSLLSRKRRWLRDQFLSNTIHDFQIRPSNPNRVAGAMSGGNAQKLLIAREIEHAKALLLVESPTAGLNISAAAFVVQKLREKSKQGTCVVVYSEDLDEMVQLSDRVLVFGYGKLIRELSGVEITTQNLGLAITDSENMSAVDLDATSNRGVTTCDS